MAVVVNHLKTLVSMVGREKKFLTSSSNRIAAGTLTASDGSSVEVGDLYRPGGLHQHVVTRRPLSSGKGGRLVMATYETYAAAGVLHWRPIWKFDLSAVPAAPGFRPSRGPFPPLPADDGRLASLAVAMVAAVMQVAAGGPSDPDLRMTQPLCVVAAAPGENAAEALRRSTVYDSKRVLRLALEAANNERGVPDCVAPEDVVVMAVRTGYQDRMDGAEYPRTSIHFRRAKDYRPVERPEMHLVDSDFVIDLPENCVLAPELRSVAFGETAPGALTVKAGTVFANPLPTGRRTKWQQAKVELMDAEASLWLQYQAVAAVAAADPDGLPPADTQAPNPDNKLTERVVTGSGMVRVCDYGYNPDRKILDRSGLGSTSAVFDLWSLTDGSHGNSRNQPG